MMMERRCVHRTVVAIYEIDEAGYLTYAKGSNKITVYNQ